jgi:hypothetical protein
LSEGGVSEFVFFSESLISPIDHVVIQGLHGVSLRPRLFVLFRNLTIATLLAKLRKQVYHIINVAGNAFGWYNFCFGANF